MKQQGLRINAIESRMVNATRRSVDARDRLLALPSASEIDVLRSTASDATPSGVIELPIPPDTWFTRLVHEAFGMAALRSQITAATDELRRSLQHRVVTTDQERTVERLKLAQANKELEWIRNGNTRRLEQFAIPVKAPYGYGNTWHAARSGHRHEGTDIFAARGTPVVATVDGTVIRVTDTPVGGLNLSVLAPDGTRYYYAHLDRFADDLQENEKVVSGEVIGFVGTTGNARTTPPHLHFEIHPSGGEPVNPYPLLQAIDRGDRAAYLTLTIDPKDVSPCSIPSSTTLPRSRPGPLATVRPTTLRPTAVRPTAVGPTTVRPTTVRPTTVRARKLVAPETTVVVCPVPSGGDRGD
jgi:murein DD-endopeptidase MepM/ murein hydrolase activator NlpD